MSLGKRFVLIIIFFLLASVGFWTSLWALVRLGWRRHGASPIDLSFFHLGWIVDYQQSYWFSHMTNLGQFFIGGAFVLMAGFGLFRTVRFH